jgi:hypothetical protein
MYLGKVLYSLEADTVIVIDDASFVPDEESMRLPVVETFKFVNASKEEEGYRKVNTFYVWHKKSQETFKGEITLNGPMGWEGDNFTFVGFGGTIKQCLEDIIPQFTTRSEIESV